MAQSCRRDSVLLCLQNKRNFANTTTTSVETIVFISAICLMRPHYVVNALIYSTFFRFQGKYH